MEMNPGAYLADLLALQTLNTSLMQRINQGRFEEMSDFFTEDAIYAEVDQIATGYLAIKQLIASRSPARHQCNAPCIDIVDAKLATGKCLQVTYFRNSPSSLAFSVYDVCDWYKFCSDGRWRITRREVLTAL